MDYIKIKVVAEEEKADIVLAFLSQQPYEVFENQPYGVDAYIAANHFSDLVVDDLYHLSKRFQFSYEQEYIPAKNWNALWEANFQPLDINHFCRIRASFHPSNPAVEHEIIIDPKMAFGTGHHPTTFLMIRLMKSVTFDQKKVLDLGCGTGILAILAAKLGAHSVMAIDIDAQAVQNTLDNIQLNQIDVVQVIEGTAAHVGDEIFDIVLANINRNTLLSDLFSIARLCADKGLVLMSGYYEKDGPVIEEQANLAGLTLINSESKEKLALPDILQIGLNRLIFS